MSIEHTVTPERIAETETLIRPHIRRTPVMRVDMRDFGGAPLPVDLKLELLQHSGSFKARGAFTNLLTRNVPAAGVVAASGGNHGAAVAYAAMKLGVPAHIFVPSVASQAKIDLIRSYGAELVVGGDRYNDALAASQTYVATSGAIAAHAYDQVETLLGQGTLGKEIDDGLPEMTTLLVAVGGGGLIGGIASWFRGRAKIVAVESDGAPTLYEAFKAGHPVDAPTGGIAADSLAPKQVGELMFPVAQKFLQPPILVTDDEILAAQKALWASARIVAEPGGAAAFAALLSGKYVPSPDERVCVLVCGSNTTAVKFD
ncbi:MULTISPECIES: threonine/serine dehydratase [unclassified Neorhizobium]|uniref:threonine/serine dehydratase n=1 Tax=unclassified Neorhizobium TaxID=2629175 RepID=UPI001FF475E1|nr:MULTISPECIES: threonine/serine dehydratase [unclassified Neorhizobium]MCJ9668894.1 threonine/serine dehydratase [Neorhizobium sp. SHOUNA12B]MCJ9743407.1 threonine/serine dehydratase [Neorhizobium sp. SHOUNA12A]